MHVRARQELPDTDLWGLAEAISTALPAGPSEKRPALMGRLPPDGLVERSAIFFHEEISIQNDLWLGGENLLGLGPETDGVLAQYDVGGASTPLSPAGVAIMESTAPAPIAVWFAGSVTTGKSPWCELTRTGKRGRRKAANADSQGLGCWRTTSRSAPRTDEKQ